MYGPYSSDTQKLPPTPKARPSVSIVMRRPLVPSSLPNPSPEYVAPGKGGKPGNSMKPVTSPSRPVVGVPSGPVRRSVSRCFIWRLGWEGFFTDASREGLKERDSFWIRAWTFRVPLVFLRYELSANKLSWHA
ncbi:hypothetical protein I7I48_09454 [Histoplasma ohiense]|nr:hypothetical protein I7I48_09454 [Histoplasma ohiense (nom. inval.)]